MDALQAKPPQAGVTQIFLTMLRKNKNEVSITTSDGWKHVGVIDAFDLAGIILFVTTQVVQTGGQIYISRAQIIDIMPTSPVTYIKPYTENDPGRGR